MPLQQVGRSEVSFRSSPTKRGAADVDAASGTFPELAEYGWPERGAKAERDSLFLQASRFRWTETPAGIKEACDELAREYPSTRCYPCLRGSQWDKEEVAEQIAQIAEQEINPAASPGVPLAVLGATNRTVLDSHMDLVVIAAMERLMKLSEYELIHSDLRPRDLVNLGFCDPVRLFVKQEPHPVKKLHQRRFRLISSVSLVDQLVERILFGPQNRSEIIHWSKIPSKPGMGLSVERQSALLWDDVSFKHSRCPAAEADISGFDWSVQWWELVADVAMRVRLTNASERLKMAMASRFYCLGNSVFQLSNGELWEQQLPGLMKSGSYCTSSSNSRIRCLMAKLIGAEWCIAMGDDSVEAYVAGAKDKYSVLGHECKDYIPCETDASGNLKSFNFCSHYVSKNRYYLATWAKTLYRFLSSDHESFEDIYNELHTNPNWARIHKYLRRIGRTCDKTICPEIDDEDGKQQESQNSCRGDSCYSPTSSTTSCASRTAPQSTSSCTNGYDPSSGFYVSTDGFWDRVAQFFA